MLDVNPSPIVEELIMTGIRFISCGGEDVIQNTNKYKIQINEVHFLWSHYLFITVIVYRNVHEPHVDFLYSVPSFLPP